jgi:ferrochelatase
MKPEPPYAHGQLDRTAILLCNLGTPQAPTSSAVRRYLREFLGDPRVVEIPRLIWWFILNCIILVTRPARSAAKYARIWTPDGSPLMVETQKLACALHQRFVDLSTTKVQDIQVDFAMRYGSPSIAQVLDKLKAQGMQRLLLVPAYPQYSATTTASVVDAVNLWLGQCRNQPEVRFIKHYHDHPAYIEALALHIERYWVLHGRGERLVMSFHGVPLRTLELGDPYHCECYKTARLLRERLGLDSDAVSITFQSRLGRAQWLQPYTEPTLVQMAQQGIRRVDVVCPGFIADCLETLEEIAIECKLAYLNAGGGQFHYINCLNDNSDWVNALYQITQDHCAGWLVSADKATRQASRLRAQALGANDSPPNGGDF